MPHWVRIPTVTGAFPNVGVGEASFSTQRYRRGVLMRGGTEHDGFAENQGTTPRAFLGANLSRGRGIRPLQREASRHERNRVCERREGHRGVGVGFAPPPWARNWPSTNGPQRNKPPRGSLPRTPHTRGSVDGPPGMPRNRIPRIVGGRENAVWWWWASKNWGSVEHRSSRIFPLDGGSPGTRGSANVATISTPRLAWQVEADVGGV